MHALAFITFIALLAALAPGASAALLWQEDFSTFRGTGLAPGGGAGRLDSDHFAVTGASAGDSDYGDTLSGGDFGRGTSAGGVTTGGIYAFDVLGNETYGLGLQPTGSDFSPGSILLRVRNDTGVVLDHFDVGFNLWTFNDGDRATRIDVGFGVFGPGGVRLSPLLDLTTPGVRDPAPVWQPWVRELEVDGLQAAPGEWLHVYWMFTDNGGRGSRDELALGRITVSGAAAAPSPRRVDEPPLLGLAALAGLAVAARRRR